MAGDRVVTVESLLSKGWVKVRCAYDCEPCEICGEPWCEECKEHYVECDCDGPTQDGYLFLPVQDVLLAKKIEEG